MKKQITAVITAALILTNLTACTNSGIENQTGDQGSVNTNSENTPSNLRNENNSLDNSNTPESKPTENVTGIYGKTEIPDIPCGELDYEGKAVVMQERDALKQSLDSMVFETHTFGDYMVSLVGDNVRTDKTNFPGSIYTQKLRVEVEKNGAKIGGDGYYNKTVIYDSQYCTEYRLFEDKIGSYLDVYDLENPVIAMRYFFDDDSAREVTKAVEFATIQNDKVYSGFVGTSAKGTGVVFNPYMDGNNPSTILEPNSSEAEKCRVSIFAADEFSVADSKALADAELGIKYTFNFSDPPEMDLYTTEKSSKFINQSQPTIGNKITAQFELPSGDPVDLTNAVVNGINGEIPLSEMTEDNWQIVTCDYVYLAEPLGIYYNSVDNADIFDENELIFKGAPETAVYKYKKYKVGDMFGDLKLTEASTSFSPDWSYHNPKYFNGGRARFEGKLTLTGKCYLYPVTEGYNVARDIHFIPDGQSAKLPIMNYSPDENGNEVLSMGMNNSFCWLGEYYSLIFGNADNYPNLDFGDFPDDGSLVDVKVTIDNIYFRNELNFTKGFGANIVDLEVIH